MQANRIRLITAVIGLALATQAGAQDAPAPETEPAPEAPATAEQPAPPAEAEQPAPPAAEAPAAPGDPAAAPAEGAPGGTAAPGAEAAAGTPAQPEVLEVIRETFGAWEIRCAPQGDECFMYQLARDAQDNPVAEFSLLKLPENAEATAGVTVVTPLGTLLPAGLVLQVDGGERRQYPFAWCSQVGCFARFGLDDATINSLKRGNAGKVTLVSVGAPETPVTLDVSLSGFTAAYDSLTMPENAPAAAPGAAPVPSLELAPAPAPSLEPAPAPAN